MFNIKEFQNMKYYEYFPKDFDSGRKYPLMLFLHGAGEREKMEQVKRYGPLHEIEIGRDLPFVIVAPFCEGNRTWFDYGERLYDFLREYMVNSYVDSKRVYVTGLSMGGYGTWSIIMAHPELFAAAMPLCGGGMVWNCSMVIDLPIWTFHGDRDDCVCITETENLVNKIRELGGTKIKYTVYEGYGHDVWTVTYSNYEVYSWLLANSK